MKDTTDPQHDLVEEIVSGLPDASFGPNRWVLEEMYREYARDASSVSETWREFFHDYEPVLQVPAAPAPAPATTPAPAPARPAAPEVTPQTEDAVALRGAAARIVENMERSLAVPTATSVRTIPAKVLEENRRLINERLRGHRGGKVSFTHLIGFAVVQAVREVPVMNAAFVDLDGKPAVRRDTQVNLGLAVDVKKRDGSRSLLVPNIKDAANLDFAAFHAAYEDLIRKVGENALGPDDFAGTSISLTNPGMIGTVSSVPRLMPGQGAIVGVGSLAWPAGFAGADEDTLARLGLSKIMTLTSTYDHRIIQGAESGEFLRRCEQLLLGEHDFYDTVFASLGMRFEPVRWSHDRSPERRGEAAVDAAMEKAAQVLQLVNMWRVRGHLVAAVDPLGTKQLRHVELDPAYYGLTVWDLDRRFPTGGLAGTHSLALREIIEVLREAYGRTVGVEYMHIQDPAEKHWIQDRVEGADPILPTPDQQRILAKLNAAEAFEGFLQTKFVGHKRFGIEGAETVIPMLDALLSAAGDDRMTEVVMGMTHRGRLNVLANVLGKSYTDIFREFEGDIDPETVQGSGDVKYHVGAEGVHVTPSGREVHVTLASNPSHLEAVDPVVEGMARAMQSRIGPEGHLRVLPVLLHGDAAFAGQGVVAETLNLSQLIGYRTGGTVHLVINNQIGFTTVPEDARSSFYATDIAKMVQAPILHVNGDDPEAAVHVVRLAFAYRQTFHKDVVIDLRCYRRYGHNEADEPSYTQPRLYEQIKSRRSVRKLYTERLVNRGDLSVDEAEAALTEFRQMLQAALDETRQSLEPDVEAKPVPPARGVLPHVATGVARDRLDHYAEVLTTLPPEFSLHPKLVRWLEDRRTQLGRDAVDWSLGEALAFASLLDEGHTIRLSGQDSRRGTFSHRHSCLVDHETEEEYCPLTALETSDVRMRVYDSLLSEYAVLGFEFGYSVVRPDALVMWEAQFGDFANGAQIVIDQFIVAAGEKWHQPSGVVLLLPHGYEGQGPEHSSARLERFLVLCAKDNIVVAQPTTSAQYFHLLRRQVHGPARRPLVVMTPKSLLRLPAARSAAGDLEHGSFEEVLGDTFVADANAVTRVLICSGRLYYDLVAERERLGRTDVAIVRLEQLYPFPADALVKELDRYPAGAAVVWVQDEPDNMGAWTFIRVRAQRFLDSQRYLLRVARSGSGSPATGSGTVHAQEARSLLDAAFALDS
ncbi:MAG: multifunctional oxoglutarate decarboxylase/oxoglutarate dehydrogenase thiamine pyrophosphate-binding subunit/dihydrolipoyllysine-residue succinyltransferase subunit [Acidimicrobiia bacterium]|nr:multifunctional oxoglutarate decarboxylase/oxoglutarate dehydrogenase thiamine pyrophosphate-binding subunit/dihydrolipoyllysine-residue succinyltransferase subunit [Acidimicrobiia bacterium]